jgi:F-type H+-transporting ATPase subunit delta
VINTLVARIGGGRLIVVSGGFAVVQPGNLLSINAVEAYPLNEFSPEAVRSGLADAHKAVNAGGSEESVAEAKIEVEVYEALLVCVF